MRTIALSHFEAILGEILAEKEEISKRHKEVFVGVSEHEVLDALKNKIGDSWTLKKIPPRITDNDFKAMASGRFYRSGGIKYLGGWMILILALMWIGSTLTFLQPYNFVIAGIVTIGFVVIYNRRQREAYRQFKSDLWGDKEKD